MKWKITKTRFETQDLILAKAKHEDLEAIYKNCWSDPYFPEIMDEPMRSLEDAKKRLDEKIELQKDRLNFLIYEKSTGEAIGEVGFVEIGDKIWDDNGFGIGRKFLGKGYEKQVFSCLVDYLFTETDAKVILSSCRLSDIEYLKMQIDCGMKFFQTKDWMDVDTKEVFTVHYRKITKEDWKNLKNIENEKEV